MGLHHLATLLPLAAPLAITRDHFATAKTIHARTSGVRNLQPDLIDEPTDATTTDVTATNAAINTDDTATNATTPDATVSAPIYTPQECNSWINTLISSDDDGSSGLSEKEYHKFLSSIDYPPYISEYFKSFKGFDQLPWVFRVVHKSLACHCEKLGMGEECCEGDDAEVLLLGLLEGSNGVTTERGVKEEYKDLFCQQISYILTKSVPSPAPTAGPTVSPTKSPSAGPTSSPSASPVSSSPTNSSSATPSVTVVLTDPEVTATPKAPELSGAPSDTPSVSLIPTAPRPVVGSKKVMGTEPEEEEKGLGIGGIIGIFVAILALIIGVLAFVAYRRRIHEEEQLRKFAGDQAPEDDLEAPTAVEEGPEQAPPPQAAPEVGAPGQEPDEDDESSAPSIWSESSEGEETLDDLHEGYEDPGVTAGSALAAMGAASTVAVRIVANSSDSD